MIGQDTMTNEQNYVELGLSCADICRALDRGMNGKKLDDLSKSVCDAINQLKTCHAEIQKKTIKQGGQHRSLDFFMRGMTRMRLPVGSLASTGSLLSSMCVRCLFLVAADLSFSKLSLL